MAQKKLFKALFYKDDKGNWWPAGLYNTLRQADDELAAIQDPDNPNNGSIYKILDVELDEDLFS